MNSHNDTQLSEDELKSLTEYFSLLLKIDLALESSKNEELPS